MSYKLRDAINKTNKQTNNKYSKIKFTKLNK